MSVAVPAAGTAIGDRSAGGGLIIGICGSIGNGATTFTGPGLKDKLLELRLLVLLKPSGDLAGTLMGDATGAAPCPCGTSAGKVVFCGRK